MNRPSSNMAVLFIDVINDFNFDGGDSLLHHTKQIVPHLVQLKKYAKENEIPLIYINDHYGLWQADYRKIIEHCMNSKSEQVIKSLAPDENDYFLIKPQHSAFFQTPLQSLLTDLNLEHLLLAGVAGDICLLFTAKDAYMYKYSMHVPKNCIASEDRTMNEYALYLMESVMDANIQPFE